MVLADSNGAAVAAVFFFLIVTVVLTILYIASLWKVFVKADKPGWAAIIPIYNLIVLLKICDLSLWMLLLLIVPPVLGIIIALKLSEKFGHGVGFALGLIFLSFIFYLILGFGSSQYQGGTGNPAPAY